MSTETETELLWPGAALLLLLGAVAGLCMRCSRPGKAWRGDMEEMMSSRGCVGQPCCGGRDSHISLLRQGRHPRAGP